MNPLRGPITQGKGRKMTKTEFVAKVAEDCGITKAAAEKAVGSVLSTIVNTLKSGDKISFVGFGSFSVGDRAARTGRNPLTGATIEVPAAKVPKFSPGQGLRDSVNGK